MNIIADELKLKNDVEANLLVEKIKSLSLIDCNLYYNFPFYRGETTHDLVKAHILLVSKEYGVIFFRCLNSLIDYSDFERKKINEWIVTYSQRSTKERNLG